MVSFQKTLRRPNYVKSTAERAEFEEGVMWASSWSLRSLRVLPNLLKLNLVGDQNSQYSVIQEETWRLLSKSPCLRFWYFDTTHPNICRLPLLN